MRFRSDSTVVGSLGIESAGFTIDGEAGHTGLRFGAAQLVPRDNGADTNGLTGLGFDQGRFRDLYLSGGVVFGATGGNVSSKTLDDYEEGTWTPADGSGAGLTFTNVTGTYTKVGRSVTVTGYLDFPTTSSTSAVKISGLPFTSLNSTSRSAGGIGYAQSVEADSMMVDGNSTTASVYQNQGSTTKNNHLSGEVLYFGFTYFVA